MTGVLIGLRRIARKLRGNRDGVGAVEFALIAPVLIVLYMGSLEISVAMSVNKKLARAASTVADLITQEDFVDKAKLASMDNVAQAVMTPFKSNGMVLKVTGIDINSAGIAKVAWSWKNDNTKPYATNSTQTLPANLAIPDTFLVRTELEFPYDMMMFLPDSKGLEYRTLNMKKTYHLRQRIGTELDCSNC
ncbi:MULTISPECIES: TadE/TadG family type IV pilus assembly protein [unclassified Hoeflea]|uniref:TadE/TadG family type IV pilus assembly protein n=1 Tax=unclassified Hoeflea TaxID=2614931 RepID=UPI002B003C6B|nr:TadE/TadG family type IV pilus assembly protein [Hoeflea sp.]